MIKSIGYDCTSGNVASGLGGKTAFRWITPSLESRNYSFSDLDLQSSRFANVIADLGFSPGEVFFTFLPKLPEQFVGFLGALKLQLITGTLFANFGDEALFDRLGDAGAKGIITKKAC